MEVWFFRLLLGKVTSCFPAPLAPSPPLHFFWGLRTDNNMDLGPQRVIDDGRETIGFMRLETIQISETCLLLMINIVRRQPALIVVSA